MIWGSGKYPPQLITVPKTVGEHHCSGAKTVEVRGMCRRHGEAVH